MATLRKPIASEESAVLRSFTLNHLSDQAAETLIESFAVDHLEANVLAGNLTRFADVP
jgi:hypothetical protein